MIPVKQSVSKGLVFILHSDLSRWHAEERWPKDHSCVVVPEHAESKGRLTDFIAETVKEYVKKYGPLSELVIEGHGCRNVVGSTKKPCTKEGLEDEYLYTSVLLDKLAKHQKATGQPITSHILFNGCETFSRLKETDIQYYRNKAHDMQADLVGTTSVGRIFLSFPMVARRVAFLPDGTVKRDKEDDRFNPLANTSTDNSWTLHYLDRTPPQAAQGLFAAMVEKAKEYVAASHRPDLAKYRQGQLEALDKISFENCADIGKKSVSIDGPNGLRCVVDAQGVSYKKIQSVSSR